MLLTAVSNSGLLYNESRLRSLQCALTFIFSQKEIFFLPVTLKKLEFDYDLDL